MKFHETRDERRARAVLIMDRLDEHYGDMGTTLDFHGDPWILLVGGILGAQATDERVNKILPIFAETFPTLEAVAGSSQEEMEEVIRTVGIFRQKAARLRESAAMLLQDYDGKVPTREADLLRLPGVGRKVANLVRSDGYGIPAIVVDTHCGRITRHFGFTRSQNPTIVERDLEQVLPVESWTHYGHIMVHHGRDLCVARNPRCAHCPVSDLCETGRSARVSKHDPVQEPVHDPVHDPVQEPPTKPDSSREPTDV